MRDRGIFDVMPAEAGIQGFKLTAFWIALPLHCVSRPRPTLYRGRHAGMTGVLG
jgi:hypothetical protein